MSLEFAHVLALPIAFSVLALIRVRSPFTVIVLLSVYSGLQAVMFALLGSVDVAFMEAVVGTSMSTIFLMALMWWIDPEKLTHASVPGRHVALAVAAGLGGLLVYGVLALPVIGDPSAPATIHVSPSYVRGAVPETATPNVVAAVLADYRSFDTLIETAVVVAAVLACLLVLKHRDATSVR